MSCDERPQGTACNCCGDEELRESIRELTNQLTVLRTQVLELGSRPQPRPTYTDCNGIELPFNTAIATCADLHRLTQQGGGGSNTGLVDCAGRPLTSAPSCAEFEGLRNEVRNNSIAINNLTNIIDRLPRPKGPNTGGGIGNAIDKAVLDGLQQQITGIAIQLNDFRNTTNSRLAELEECCADSKRNQDQSGSCNFNGWHATMRMRKVGGTSDDMFTYTVTVTGPANKAGVIDIVGKDEYQRSFVLNAQGSYVHVFNDSSAQFLRPTSARVVHCGRVVATAGVGQ